MTSTSSRRGVLAVASQSGPTISFYDLDSGFRLLHRVEVPAEPHELIAGPGTLLYCTQTYLGGYYHANAGRGTRLLVLDIEQRAVVDAIDLSPEHAPHALQLTRGGDYLYVSVEGRPDAAGALLCLDTSDLRVVNRISVDAPGPHWFAITPDGKKAYSANKEAPFVTVVDLTSGEICNRIAVPGSEGIAVSPDGRWVAVSAPNGRFSGAQRAEVGVRLIDTDTDEIVAIAPTQGVPCPVHFTTDGTLLTGEVRFTPATTDSALGGQRPGRLRLFASGTWTEIGEVPVGRLPLTITSSPDGSRAFVSAVLDSTVTVVDLSTRAVETVLRMGKAGETEGHGLADLPAEEHNP